MKKVICKPISVMVVIALLCNLMTFTVLSATTDEYNSSRADIKVNVSSSYTNASDGYSLYNGDDLGAKYTPTATTFKVWAPSASKVQVKLYSKGSDAEQGAEVLSTNDMQKDNSTGVWSFTAQGDQKNVYYTYLVTVNGKVNETRDIYATAAGVNGKRSMVVDLNSTNPDGWENDSHVLFDEATYAMVWEVSVRDFSIDSSSGVDKDKMGKYLGMAQHGTTLNGAGSYKTGIDYLIENHINCVQIMPMFDFGSVDETKGGQNWGYDPYNYNVPEGSFSSDPYNGDVRIKELKTMIKALHDAGISVIMDVVYNHTYNTTDSAFELTVPGYYYRMNGSQFLNGSGCGNVTASDKAMYRKYMIDSLKYWASEYHIDGFRFDLMGCHDVTTMNKIRAELDTIDKRIIVYGEPWTGTWPRDPNGIADSEAALMDNASKLDPRVGSFNDKFRDGIRGSNDNWGAAPGYINNNTASDGAIKAGLMANTSSMWGSNWSKAPCQTVSYSCCHDNLTLWDKIMKVSGSNDYDGTNGTFLAMNKLAAVLEFAAQGVNFTVAGEDFARTKHGDENSYNTGDAPNKIDWSRVQKYNDLVQYYKGLRLIRNAYSPFTDGSMTSVNSSYYATTDAGVVAFTMQNKTKNAANEWGMVAVIANSNGYDKSVTLQAGTTLPSQWATVANGSKAGLTNLNTVSGSTVTVPARSALILVDKASFDAKNIKETTKPITAPSTKPTTVTTTTEPTTEKIKTSMVVWNTTGLSNMEDGEKAEVVKETESHITQTLIPAQGKVIDYVKVVRGGEDITAEAYNATTQTIEFDATENTGIVVIAVDEGSLLTGIYGDADLSGSVNIKDAALIQKVVVKLKSLSWEAEQLSDVDDDGSVTIKDATMIQKYIAKYKTNGRVGVELKGQGQKYTIPTITFPTSETQTAIQPTQTQSQTQPTTVTYTEPTISNTSTVYLDVSKIATADARYAAYFFEGATSSVWVDMVKVNENVYSVSVPAGYSRVIFCRMNGAKAENNWDNRWNQSDDLTIDGNLYTSSGWGSSNLFTGSWSTSSTYTV